MRIGGFFQQLTVTVFGWARRSVSNAPHRYRSDYSSAVATRTSIRNLCRVRERERDKERVKYAQGRRVPKRHIKAGNPQIGSVWEVASWQNINLRSHWHSSRSLIQQNCTQSALIHTTIRPYFLTVPKRSHQFSLCRDNQQQLCKFWQRDKFVVPMKECEKPAAM